ncbi:MAG: Macrolide ABC transporter ATP-binding protein [Actinobacteria bacterium]|nr:Macrolide ABC transporter ATP-binding protein [Actinomycetota bacterium]MBM2828834.1 Macrolide transporter ATP-binding protein [Actinomycetota bacterium]
MGNPSIEIDNLSKTYHLGEVSVEALRDVTLSIARGEFIAVMGASGSGKSTLMNILGCLDRPTSGSYRLDGDDVGTLSRDALAGIRRKKIGFVFQGFNLLSRMTALENVELPMIYDDTPAATRLERAREALRAVGILDREHHLPSQMSGGQQQRVAIARAIVNTPSLLLADEPTGNLDSVTSIEIMKTFQGLADERGITLVLVTHEDEISRYSKRIVRFRDGKVVSDSPVVPR